MTRREALHLLPWRRRLAWLIPLPLASVSRP
jgi:hypothetical protein